MSDNIDAVSRFIEKYITIHGLNELYPDVFYCTKVEVRAPFAHFVKGQILISLRITFPGLKLQVFADSKSWEDDFTKYIVSTEPKTKHDKSRPRPRRIKIIRIEDDE